MFCLRKAQQSIGLPLDDRLAVACMLSALALGYWADTLPRPQVQEGVA